MSLSRGEFVYFVPGGILTLAFDCTQHGGVEAATNAQQLRDALWARQRVLKGHDVGTAAGPTIQLTTLLVSRDAWDDVMVLLNDPAKPVELRMQDMVASMLSSDGSLAFSFPQEPPPDGGDDDGNARPLYTFDTERSTPYAESKWSVRMAAGPWGAENANATNVCETALVTALVAELHARMPDKYPAGGALDLETDELHNLLYRYTRDGAVVDSDAAFLRPFRRWFGSILAAADAPELGYAYSQVVAPIMEMGAIENTRVGFLPNEERELQRAKGQFNIDWLEPLRVEVTALMRAEDRKTPFPDRVTFDRTQLLAALSLTHRAHVDPTPPSALKPV
tara:strand:- start:1184 stop:2191 length:1008 start_codon:yes stop_codon:yes gene_type:complete